MQHQVVLSSAYLPYNDAAVPGPATIHDCNKINKLWILRTNSPLQTKIDPFGFRIRSGRGALNKQHSNAASITEVFI